MNKSMEKVEKVLISICIAIVVVCLAALGISLGNLIIPYLH